MSIDDLLSSGSIYLSDDFVQEMVGTWFDFNKARPEFADLGEVSFSDASEEVQAGTVEHLRQIIQLTALVVERDMEFRLAPHADDIGEIFYREDGDFGFRIIARNGENIGGSGAEGYTRVADAERALRRMRCDITNIRYDVTAADDSNDGS